MIRKSILARIAAIVAAVGPAYFAAPACARDPVWAIETGFLSGYHANYFLRGDDENQPDEIFLTAYGAGSLRLAAGAGLLEVYANGSGAFALENSRADYQTATGGLQYKLRRTRATLEYRRMQNRVFGEEADSSLYDVDTGAFRLLQRIGSRFALDAGFEIDDRTFDPPDRARDSLTYEVEGAARWKVVRWLNLRGAFVWADRDARARRYDWVNSGFIVSAEVAPRAPLRLLLKYRKRWRDYDDAVRGESNFNRRDEIDDGVAEARYRINDTFGVQLRGTYRHSNSTRPDRDYDAGSVTGGVFMTFGGAIR